MEDRKDEIRFEWDDRKNQINIKKHGISFLEAEEAFFDDCADRFDDPEHSIGEERFLLIGATVRGLLMVCHCYREEGEVIRLISARKATKNERLIYIKENE